MAFDGMKAMHRRLAIEIINDDPSGVNGLKVYHRRNSDTVRLVARGVEDEQLMDVLNDKQWRAFESGTWKFKVEAHRLCETFQYLA